MFIYFPNFLFKIINLIILNKFLKKMIIPNKVLLLKSQISDDKYETILKAKNFEVMQIKTLDFNFKNLKNLEEKLKNWDEYSGLILSSPRCVQAVKLSSQNGDFLSQWKGKYNFVVGETTCKAALEKLGLDCSGKDSGNAENLSKVILQNKTKYSKPFLMPHGNLKTDTINLELEKEGLQIESIEVYETIANPNIELDLSKITNNFKSMPEFVVFFSPSGFNSCIDLLKTYSEDLNKIKFIALGPVTELAIKEKNYKVYGVARRPNAEELLNVILS